MWTFVNSNLFPETGEYIQKMIPDTIDEPISYAGAIKFKFRSHTDQKGFVYPIPGLRTSKNIQYRIETQSSFDYKPGDIIRFNTDDKLRYKVTSIDLFVDGRNEEEYIFKSSAWPGLANDKVKIKIITLE